MTLITQTLPPGVNLAETAYSQKGRFVGGQYIRFDHGVAAKIGGWEKLIDLQFTGICRGLLAATDSRQAKRLFIGTNTKFMYFYAEDFTDITPIRSTGTLSADPFVTTSGQATVEVTHVAHGANDYDSVTFSGATAAGGITIDGEYQLRTVDADHYTITHSSNASSSATGGGASVAYTYEINSGLETSAAAFGYGVGPYGMGTYGTARSTSVLLAARTWYLSAYGEDVVACPRGGNIYLFDSSAGGRAAIVTNAPTSNVAAFVDEQRICVAVGAGNERDLLKWCDQEDLTDWTAAEDNTAGERRLNDGTELVGGVASTNGINLIWSEKSLWLMQYVGGKFIYNTRRVGTAGLLSPMVAAEVDGTVYWMGPGGFYIWNGALGEIPNERDIHDYVFTDINMVQKAKFFAGANTLFKEIWFFYCSADSDEIDRMIKVNYDNWAWDASPLVRTAWEDRGVFDYPYAADANRYIQQHESGVDDNGAALDSYVVAGPQDILDGQLQADILGVIPDIKDQTGTLTLTLLTKQYPNETATEEGPYSLTTSTGREDTRASGRQVGWKVRSNEVGGFFRLGAIRFDVEQAGTRR